MDQAPYDIIPCVSVHPDRINVYKELIWHNDKRRKNSIAKLIKQDKNHGNKISKQSGRKISKAISYLLYMANSKKAYSQHTGKAFRFKVSFITLTLSSLQQHSDTVIKNILLNQFLIEVKKRWQVSHYIWRAEKQNNGNIHFHILTDKFIPHSELKDVWNRIQNKLQYVDNYRENMRSFFANGFRIRDKIIKFWSEKDQRKAYVKGVATDWASPNSTDIHSLYFVNSIEKYLAKYLKKESQAGDTTGRLWGCSTSLSNLKGAQSEIDYQTDVELRKLKELYKPHIFSGEYYSVIFISFTQIIKAGLPIFLGLISSYLSSQFNYSIQKLLT